jgi:hypothetical protein
MMTVSAKPRQMPAGEFKAKCLSVLDRVQRTGKAVVVTKRGCSRMIVLDTPRLGLVASD